MYNNQGSMAVCWANPWGMTGLTGWEELGFYRADSRTKPHYPAKKKDRTRIGQDKDRTGPGKPRTG